MTTFDRQVERFVAFARRNPVIVDGALAVVLFLIALNWTMEGKVPRDARGLAIVVAVVATAPVVVRRRYPVPAAAVTAVVAAAGTFTLSGTLAAYVLPSLVMGYSAVAYGPPWAGRLTAAVLAVGMFGPLLALGLLGPDPELGWFAPLVLAGFLLLVLLCVLLFGAMRRAQRRYGEQLHERARLLEEGRRQEVRIELLAERSRISREVHDIIAHALSGIIAQADGGQYAARRDPQKAVEVLAGIGTAGREALGDIRGLLSVLRDTGPLDGDGTDRPQPGTEHIPALVEQVRAGGLPVDVAVTGTPRALGAGAGLTAYRVVQEALTNVIKHAGRDTPTHVTLAWTADELTVSVRDEGARGTPPTPPRGGHGVVGMRERAALHGGSVDIGPHPDGGWAVRLRLPIAPEPRP
ncbi:sensor histidine kinase [Pseudonocardia zijingensis]|jgi:signal transduction histidine kinase|uniref:histidine kinase n=1 Tax=Pseudonocardia zijingensis TaxID=153376 RepID=A0ABP4AY07_9PSEU